LGLERAAVARRAAQAIGLSHLTQFFVERHPRQQIIDARGHGQRWVFVTNQALGHDRELLRALRIPATDGREQGQQCEARHLRLLHAIRDRFLHYLPSLSSRCERQRAQSDLGQKVTTSACETSAE
jgi:hypothetical protein